MKNDWNKFENIPPNQSMIIPWALNKLSLGFCFIYRSVWNVLILNHQVCMLDQMLFKNFLSTLVMAYLIFDAHFYDIGLHALRLLFQCLSTDLCSTQEDSLVSASSSHNCSRSLVVAPFSSNQRRRTLSRHSQLSTSISISSSQVCIFSSDSVTVSLQVHISHLDCYCN